jgi:peroxiredoxin
MLRSLFKLLVVLFVASVMSLAALGQSEVATVHHGLAADDQTANARYSIIEGLDVVRFEGSTPVDQAARLFDQGLTLWLAGWNREADHSFRGVVACDPQWPMGYWALALVSTTQAKSERMDFDWSENPFAKDLSPQEKKLVAITDLASVKAELLPMVSSQAEHLWLKGSLDFSDIQANAEGESFVQAIGKSVVAIPTVPRAAALWLRKHGRVDQALPMDELALQSFLKSTRRMRISPSDVPELLATVDDVLGQWIADGRIDDAMELAMNVIDWPTDIHFESRTLGRRRLIEACIAGGRWEQLMSHCGGRYLAADDSDPSWGDQWRYAAAIASFELGEGQRGLELLQSLQRRAAAIDALQSPDRKATIKQWIQAVQSHRIGPTTRQPIVREDLAGKTIEKFLWHPESSPQWGARLPDGQLVFGDQYRGRPTVILFYLGFGCLHCVEQLQKFAEKASSFSQAGVELIAVSTETPQQLKQSMDDFDGEMPMELVSDADGAIFSAFGCVNPLDRQYQHGVFVIDANAKIRWWNVDDRPFMDAELVLRESLRTR